MGVLAAFIRLRTRCRHCQQVFSAASFSPATPCPICGKLSSEPKEGEAPFAKDFLKLVGTALVICLVLGGGVLLVMNW